jgi:prepilin-type N-terminal cleavage/methylation domain-containing protein/prepilin-type processing-associated H-X9-DG protein
MKKQYFHRSLDAATMMRRTDGFTVLELIVVVSILGILAGLLLPAVGAARETARRIQCTSHLRQVGLAMHNHHAASNQLPAGWKFDEISSSGYGWAVSLLPYIEQPGLAGQINIKIPLNDPKHATACETALAIMLCPSDITEPMFTLFADDENGDDDAEDNEDANIRPLTGIRQANISVDPVALIRLPTANYVAMFGTLEADDSIPAPIGDGAFIENQSRRFCDFQRGLSNTLVVGERTMAQVPSTWIGVSLAGEDAAARLVGSALEGINNPIADECDYSSRHPGGANFLSGDGHVSFITEDVDLRLYHQWSRLREN